MKREFLTMIVVIPVTFTLCLVVASMVFALMDGLYDDRVNNDEIFKLIAPAFQTVIGGFIGLLAGVKLNEPKQ